MQDTNIVRPKRRQLRTALAVALSVSTVPQLALPSDTARAQDADVELDADADTDMNTDANADAVRTAQAPDSDDASLWAARVCYLEASWREDDCVAVLWVTRRRARRAQKPWLDMLREYSAIQSRSERAREIRDFPWGDIPEKPQAFNAHWSKLRNVVVEFTQGKRRNPCPHAEHWGGSMDHAHGRMVPARCAASMANTFYTVQR